MGRSYRLKDHHAETIENAIQALEDTEGIDVDRTRGPTRDGAISTSEAIGRVAEAYTGWSP